MFRILIVFVMLVSGTATSQLPEFSQQYRQRLGGAIDALEEILADFNRDASAFGLSVAEAIERQRSSEDPFVRARGDSMAVADTRLERLKMQRDALENAGQIERLLVFAQGFDPQLARATAEDYEPAIPITVAGFFSAGLGALAGFVFVTLFAGVMRLGRRKTASRP
ncbi:DUF2937 family protein [Roseibium sp. MMSF_3412]|uniref:DUF2937 family protein n=1 Tax=Roseibium sp. MMSF_3412 TaxID=3046712 RepID=UPI00273EA493|nr:DUF2937 family protein [Roseibium sp. MMSF_3412]